jgi:tetratricopeptide (TPR) repeat protein
MAPLRDFEKAVELHPTMEGRLGLAGALYRVGRPWDAMLEYERLRQMQPVEPEVLLGLAQCRYSLHELDGARQLLDQLLAKNPDHAAALLERGRLTLNEGKLAEAENWLRRAANSAPAYDLEPLRLLHRCLDLQHKDEARPCLAQLRSKEADILRVSRLTLQTNRDSRNVGLRYETAMDLLRLDREEDGVAGLYFVLDQDPRHIPSHEALADYFERKGQSARAAFHRRASLARGAAISTPR